jgi:hypothetical protein
MEFTREYLLDLAEGKIRGDMAPFTTGNPANIEQHLKKMVSRMQRIYSLTVVADFTHYGSGYASYVHLYISKKDKSGMSVEWNGEKRTEVTTGLMLYLCRLAPYAVYAIGDWATTYENDKVIGGGSHFIEPENIGTIPDGDWDTELSILENVVTEYGYTMLSQDILDKPLDFQVRIPTILSQPPYSVFDCLFYWED